MDTIRQAASDDLEALYHICLKTGDSGVDATGLYDDPELIGNIYAAPYLTLAPELAFVAERDGKVVGYCVGASDTRAFEDRLEAEWWPRLRERHAMPDPDRQADWSPDERLSDLIHSPTPAPDDLVAEFPAHVHMNLLLEAQGAGLGRALLEAWFQKAKARGVSAVHLGASPANDRGIRFWGWQGFAVVDVPDSSTVWMAQRLAG